MAKAKTPVEVLKAMEWIITNVGWCQWVTYRDKTGRFIGEDDEIDASKLGSVCLSGAMLLTNANWQAIIRATELFREVNKIGMVAFNDAPGRTKKQVINALRKAIKKGSKK